MNGFKIKEVSLIRYQKTKMIYSPSMDRIQLCRIEYANLKVLILSTIGIYKIEILINLIGCSSVRFFVLI